MSIVNLDRDLKKAQLKSFNYAMKELWGESPKAAQLMVNGEIPVADAVFINNFVESGKYDGIFSREAQDAAADAILAQRRKVAEETAAQLALADQIEAYMTENKIAQDDQAINIIAELQRDPAFSFEKFVTFVELHPEKFNHLVGFKAFSMLDAVRHAPVGQRELRRKYGDAVVDSALAQLAKNIRKGANEIHKVRQAAGESNLNTVYTQEDASADQKKREAEFQKSPLYRIQQAGWKRECENVVSSFIVALDGQRIDHGATQDARKELRQAFDEGVAAGTPWNVLRDQLKAQANHLAGIGGF